jgi:hypothetical protein
VPQDNIEAYVWYDLAAEQDHQNAAEERSALARLMTPGQIAEAQRLAREWKPVAERQ